MALACTIQLQMEPEKTRAFKTHRLSHMFDTRLKLQLWYRGVLKSVNRKTEGTKWRVPFHKPHCHIYHSFRLAIWTTQKRHFIWSVIPAPIIHRLCQHGPYKGGSSHGPHHNPQSLIVLISAVLSVTVTALAFCLSGLMIILVQCRCLLWPHL